MKLVLLSLSVLIFLLATPVHAADSRPTLWKIQSIDTMKFSRDMARSESNNPAFDHMIDKQMSDIASTGATHVAIATPYDAEFIPFLTRWTKSARSHGLLVWFRGNFSGWENWFGYPDISRVDHINKTKAFILANPDLFADGDIYSPCHECENGGDGDPRSTGDVKGYRQFLIDEYGTTKEAFKEIGKNVASNYFSMNLDVAKLIMDKQTVTALDSIIVLDHYVDTPTKLAKDVASMAKKTNAQIVLGEYGVPIPDIHGSMTAEGQAKWIKEAMGKLIQIPGLMGLNYWINADGSTEIWQGANLEKKPAVDVIASFFSPKIVSVSVIDRQGNLLTNAKIIYLGRNFTGLVPVLSDYSTISVSAPGFRDKFINVDVTKEKMEVVLDSQTRDFFLLPILRFIQSVILKSFGKS